MPMCWNVACGDVELGAVADFHLLAPEKNEAIGKRFIATSGQNITYKKQAEFLKKEFGTKAKKVSTHVIPDFLVKILARFDKSLAMPATFLGQNTACSNEKSVKLLGWKPRSGKQRLFKRHKRCWIWELLKLIKKIIVLKIFYFRTL